MGIQEVSEIIEIWFSDINAVIAHKFVLDLWVLEIVVTEVQPSLCLQTQETNKTKDFLKTFFGYVLQGSSRWVRWSIYLSLEVVSFFKKNNFDHI